MSCSVPLVWSSQLTNPHTSDTRRLRLIASRRLEGWRRRNMKSGRQKRERSRRRRSSRRLVRDRRSLTCCRLASSSSVWDQTPQRSHVLDYKRQVGWIIMRPPAERPQRTSCRQLSGSVHGFPQNCRWESPDPVVSLWTSAGREVFSGCAESFSGPWHRTLLPHSTRKSARCPRSKPKNTLLPFIILTTEL